MSVSSTPRVVGYTRTATEAQDRQTLDGQRETLERSWQSEDGKQTVPPATRFYEDSGISGYAPWQERPGLDALLRDAGCGEFDVVRVASADRLSRSRADQADILDALEDLGIEILIHDAVPDSPWGLPMLRMQAEIARKERAYIEERIAAQTEQGQ